MSGGRWGVGDGYADGDRNMNMDDGRGPLAGREGTMRTENIYFHTPRSRSLR